MRFEIELGDDFAPEVRRRPGEVLGGFRKGWNTSDAF